MRLGILMMVSFLVGSSLHADSEIKIEAWSFFANVSTLFETRGCVAETRVQLQVADELMEFNLQVLKLVSNNGEYTPAIVVAFPTQGRSPKFFEAQVLHVFLLVRLRLLYVQFLIG